MKTTYPSSPPLVPRRLQHLGRFYRFNADYEDVTKFLEKDGVKKFADSFDEPLVYLSHARAWREALQ